MGRIRFPVILVITILSIFILLSGLISSSTRAQSQSSMVYVLEDSDPDYSNPPFSDTLAIIDPSNHTVSKKISGLNTCATIGGFRAATACDNGQSVIIIEYAADRMSKYTSSGDCVFSINRKMGAVDVSEDGTIYALADSGTIYGEKVVKIGQDGRIVKEASYGGLDIAVDDSSDSVWIAGADIKRLNKNLELQFSIDPITWAVLSVDFTSKGDAWVAEGSHPEFNGSKERLLKITLEGNVDTTIDMTVPPTCLSVDRNTDCCWVTTPGSLCKYNEKGNLIQKVNSSGGGESVRVNQTDGSVWVAGYSGVKHYAENGVLIASISGFTPSREAFVTLWSTIPQVRGQGPGLLGEFDWRIWVIIVAITYVAAILTVLVLRKKRLQKLV